MWALFFLSKYGSNKVYLPYMMYINKRKGLYLNNMNTYRIIRKDKGFNNWRSRLFDAIRTEKPFFFVKLDTTGFNANKDDIIGISIVKAECIDGEYKKTNTYDSLIHTDKKLSGEIVEITGIRQMDVRKAPDKELVKKEVKQFIGENACILGFNTVFIGSFLQDWNLSIEATFDLNVISRALLAGKSGYKYLAVEFDTPSPVRIFNRLCEMAPHGTKPITRRMMLNVSGSGAKYEGTIGDCKIKIKRGSDKFGDYLNIEYDNKDLFEDYSPESLCLVL